MLPAGATGFQWRVADIDSLAFELRSVSERLIVSKLGKRTGEFGHRLREAMEWVAERTARVLQRLFPFLAPEQFRRAAILLEEGRSESLRNLNALDTRTGPALLEKTVDAAPRPYVQTGTA